MYCVLYTVFACLTVLAYRMGSLTVPSYCTGQRWLAWLVGVRTLLTR